MLLVSTSPVFLISPPIADNIITDMRRNSVYSVQVLAIISFLTGQNQCVMPVAVVTTKQLGPSAALLTGMLRCQDLLLVMMWKLERKAFLSEDFRRTLTEISENQLALPVRGCQFTQAAIFPQVARILSPFPTMSQAHEWKHAGPSAPEGAAPPGSGRQKKASCKGKQPQQRSGSHFQWLAKANGPAMGRGSKANETCRHRTYYTGFIRVSLASAWYQEHLHEVQRRDLSWLLQLE